MTHVSWPRWFWYIKIPRKTVNNISSPVEDVQSKPDDIALSTVLQFSTLYVLTVFSVVCIHMYAFSFEILLDFRPTRTHPANEPIEWTVETAAMMAHLLDMSCPLCARILCHHCLTAPMASVLQKHSRTDTANPCAKNVSADHFLTRSKKKGRPESCKDGGSLAWNKKTLWEK